MYCSNIYVLSFVKRQYIHRYKSEYASWSLWFSVYVEDKKKQKKNIQMQQHESHSFRPGPICIRTLSKNAVFHFLE